MRCVRYGGVMAQQEQEPWLRIRAWRCRGCGDLTRRSGHGPLTDETRHATFSTPFEPCTMCLARRGLRRVSIVHKMTAVSKETIRQTVVGRRLKPEQTYV